MSLPLFFNFFIICEQNPTMPSQRLQPLKIIFFVQLLMFFISIKSKRCDFYFIKSDSCMTFTTL
ncbi:hypothetical protein HanRHA438_Chr08g0342181 [Helianthus annuus]|nr:hypothetical protein HanRHA438_Chr08g0342181 [Helianthus annuus]